MKIRLLIILSTILSIRTIAQDIRVKSVSKNVLIFDSGTQKLLSDLGIADRFHVSRYHEYADFTSDGIEEFFIGYTANR
jgi:hypothetical protein